MPSVKSVPVVVLFVPLRAGRRNMLTAGCTDNTDKIKEDRAMISDLQILWRENIPIPLPFIPLP